MDGRGESFCLGHDPSCLKAMCEQVLYYRQVTARWERMRNSRAPARFRPNGWPFGLQSRCRLGTFEPAKNLESGEVLALGNPCETAQPQQDSGPMGGRLAPLNPLKTWRVERYWRWATHAKQRSPSRIQAQWVAVWSAEPMSFGHL